MAVNKMMVVAEQERSAFTAQRVDSPDVHDTDSQISNTRN